MHKILPRLMVAAVALTWTGALQAQGTSIVPEATDRTTRVGTRGANFLHVGVGARSQGMAGAAVGLIDGPSAMFWNPANIANREGINAFVSYMKLFGNSGITNTGAAISASLGQGAIGLALQQYSSGDMQRTTEGAPSGDDPVFPGTFEWTGTAVSAYYARNVTDRLAAAVGARWATEGIDFASSSYFGIDISTRFRTGLYGLTVGASLQNVGSSGSFEGVGVQRAITQARANGQPTGRDLPVAYRTRDAQMPTTFQFGLLSSLIGDAEALLSQNPSHSLAAELDFMDAVDTDLQTALGVEYGFRQTYFLRGGKRFFNEQHSPWEFADGLSFGGGARIPVRGRRLTVDYAFVKMGELQHNQVLSFEFGQ
jgi:hypothetical protein